MNHYVPKLSQHEDKIMEEPMRLKDKFAVVTGAAMGMGKAIAERLASEGATVVVTDMNEKIAKETADGICKNGGKAEGWKLDVTDRTQIKSVVAGIIKKFGRIDIWVNNAGISTMTAFLDLTEGEWDNMHNVNGSGVFGKIVNNASMAGKRGGNAPYLAHYVYTKFGVVGLTQAMAKELAPYGINVNAVCPGYVATPMQERELIWEGKIRNMTPDAVFKSYIDDTPLGRIETPDDIAKVVAFLASSDSDFITGESINVNGGAYMD
jgi:meso-butanediol dehydrogenase/(S,S)-butanediol dehydrogenase/diacetyl reductase